MTRTTRSDDKAVRELLQQGEAHAFKKKVGAARAREYSQDAVAEVLLKIAPSDPCALDAVKREIDRAVNTGRKKDQRAQKQRAQGAADAMQAGGTTKRKYEPKKVEWHQAEPGGRWLPGGRELHGRPVIAMPADPLAPITAADVHAAEFIAMAASWVEEALERRSDAARRARTAGDSSLNLPPAAVSRSLLDSVRRAYVAMRGHEPADADDVGRVAELAGALTWVHSLAPENPSDANEAHLIGLLFSPRKKLKREKLKRGERVPESGPGFTLDIDRAKFEELLHKSQIFKSGRGGKPHVRRVALNYVNATFRKGKAKLRPANVWPEHWPKR